MTLQSKNEKENWWNISIVLVCLGFYHKMPQNGPLINNKSLFPTDLEAGNSTIGIAGHCQGLVKALFGCRLLMFSWVLIWWKGRVPLSGLFYKGISSIHWALPSRFSPLPILTPNIISLGIGFSTYEFLGDTNIQSITPTKWIRIQYHHYCIIHKIYKAT